MIIIVLRRLRYCLRNLNVVISLLIAQPCSGACLSALCLSRLHLRAFVVVSDQPTILRGWDVTAHINLDVRVDEVGVGEACCELMYDIARLVVL